MIQYQTILLVDDDGEDQEIFLDAIQEIDPLIQCSFANDGEEAIQLLGGDALVKPDLLFIDMNMPKLNGKQVLLELKKSGNLIGIPVIMYSTFFGPKDIDEITSLGAVHYMVKATKFSDLCTSLRHILSRRW
ncbi:MAG TPA: response regulator [Chryseolinea sp.]|nr:response regulator [Chryseolinea sp.]